MWKKTIFDDDEDDLHGGGGGFKINENYATHYDNWRYKEEHAKLKAREHLMDESSDTSGDEDGKDLSQPDNPDFDKEFLLSLGMINKIKAKDKDKIKNINFFKGDYRLEKEKKEKPMTLKDFERHVMVNREGQFEEEDKRGLMDNEHLVKSGNKVKLEDGLEESDEEDDLLTSGLFKPKEVTGKLAKKDENPANSEPTDLLEKISGDVKDFEHKEALQTLKSTWKDGQEKLSKKDKWLVNFFLKQKYLDEDEEDNQVDVYSEDEISSDEDEPGDGNNPLAVQYKFRHQESGELLRNHPRSIENSMRMKDDKRKQQRHAQKARQIDKKEQKRKEIELLKAFKYKEIEEKIDKIKAASGNLDIDLGEVHLDEDFDPEAHDTLMEKVLGEDYYNNDEEELLPEFEYEPDDTKLFDNWTQATTSNAEEEIGEEQEFANEEEDYDEEVYEEDFNMDADYNPTQQESKDQRPAKSKTRRKTKLKRSNFSKVMEKKRPVFNPDERNFSSYFDEYYKLDFEDIVGGMPCRFKYRNVEPNNFGLTTGEIFAASDADLNKWVGLKKIQQYHRTKEMEDRERQGYRDKANCLHIKQKCMPSLFDEDPEKSAEREREKRRLRNLKRKQKKAMLREEIEAMQNGGSAAISISGGLAENEIGNKPDSTEKGNANDSVNDMSQRKKRSHIDENEETQSPKKKKKKQKDSEIQSKEIITDEKKEKCKDKEAAEKTSIVETTTSNETDNIKKKKKKKKRSQEVNTEKIEIAAETKNEIVSSPTKKLSKKDKERSEMTNKDKITNSKKNKKEKGIQKSGEKQNPIKKKKAKKNMTNKAKKIREHVQRKKLNVYFKGISDSRLEAYGEKPKKLKTRVLYDKNFC